jgi:hypothetical protein
MLAETLAWGALFLLLISPPVLAFGMLGPGAEHERITRVALACPPGKKSTGDCFEPLSIKQLAGIGIVGAVELPDAGENLSPLAHCDDADYIDYAKYGIPGTYPINRTEATRALQGCVTHLSDQFREGIAGARGLLDDKNNIIKSETDLSKDECEFVRIFRGKRRRAKCNAMEGLGRALHGVQDFYTHSNWVDEHDKTKPISVLNPPGLGLSAPAPLLNLRGVTIPAVPPELATGCFIALDDITPVMDPSAAIELDGQTVCIAQGRLLTHATLNKDEGTINVIPGVSIPPPSPLTSTPLTPRGRIARNFELAVQAAIKDTRRQWSDFRAELVSVYGPKRASRMICALVSDHPWKDCTGRKIALVIDSSGSNKDTDPGYLRVAAAQAFAATLVTEAAAGPDNFPDRVSVVDFDDSARVIYPLGDPASVSFDGIDAVGGTVIGSGVALAIDELTKDATGETQDHAGIIVFTDGQDNDPGPLATALDLALRLRIRVSFGFLSPPPNPVQRRRSIQRRARGPHPRQSDSSPATELLEAVLKTGGVFSTIDSAEAQQSFIELVIARGPTNIDAMGANNGGPLFQGVTVYGLSSPARGPDVFTYHATAGQNLTFEIQAVTGPALNTTLNDVRGPQELATVVTDDRRRGEIAYEASADVDLQLIISTTASAGNATGLYSVKLVVTPPDKEQHGSDTCNTPNGSSCQPLGERKCCGTGFLICDHGGTVFLHCGPGTACRSDNGTGVYCGWP